MGPHCVTPPVYVLSLCLHPPWGHCTQSSPVVLPQDKSAEMLRRLIHAFDQLQDRRTYHINGNHCYYHFPRHQLNEMLQIPPAADGASYYSFSPQSAWRFVVIDAYDISLLGWPADHPRHKLAQAILDRENPNEVSETSGAAPLVVQVLGASQAVCNVWSLCCCQSAAPACSACNGRLLPVVGGARASAISGWLQGSLLRGKACTAGVANTWVIRIKIVATPDCAHWLCVSVC